jgi:hypothetical protein
MYDGARASVTMYDGARASVTMYDGARASVTMYERPPPVLVETDSRVHRWSTKSRNRGTTPS